MSAMGTRAPPRLAARPLRRWKWAHCLQPYNPSNSRSSRSCGLCYDTSRMTTTAITHWQRNIPTRMAPRTARCVGWRRRMLDCESIGSYNRQRSYLRAGLADACLDARLTTLHVHACVQGGVRDLEMCA
ncbi:unnamed protein product [Mycena citricolor]|uniref:Uncharacterized protein n=1 Tax=Mycena citricolor TaxID=2018698 RepID=A0AAD2HLV8_9AGAR|nr:unnamed protein product [Mycena citricolor]